MLSTDELALARADAVREMPDRVTISRLVGATLDPSTLVESPDWDDLYTNLPATIVKVAGGTVVIAEGAPEATDSYHVFVPASTTGIRPGDRITTTTSGDADRPDLFVERINSGSVTVARVLICQEDSPAFLQGDYPEASS